MEVLQFPQVSALQALVAGDLFLELQMERVERLERPRELFVGEPKALEVLRVISEATLLLAAALDRSRYSFSFRIIACLRSSLELSTGPDKMCIRVYTFRPGEPHAPANRKMGQ